MTDTAIRPLRPDEVDAAAQMLARAFVGRPFPSLLGDNPAARFAGSVWMFGALLRYGLAYGVVETIGDLEGVAIWCAPEYIDLTEERAREVGFDQGPEIVGADAWARIDHYDAVAARLHEDGVSGPHWYLTVVASDPACRGRGVASRLLASMFARLDRDRLPAYLDTNVAENVAFYQRRGFVMTGEAVDPASGILIRGMRRDPQ